MKKIILVSVIFYILTAISSFTIAQNFDQLSGGKLFSVSGGVNLNQIFYTAYGNESRRDPYNFFLSGNLNFNFIGFAVPLSFSYSNKNTSFQQPFNQFTLTPTYKNIKGYVGYNSLTFSKYTLSGHIFFGGGVEVTQIGKWDVSAMYGRLRKAVAPDSLSNNNEPSFKRIGLGTKVTYKGAASDHASLIFFKSSDDPFSINFTDDLEIRPEDNFVMSLEASKTLFKNIALKAEYSGSALTQNVRLNDTASQEPTLFSFARPFYSQNSSTAYYDAFNSSLSYTGSFYSLAVNYERVDPGYETHGAYFFNNDLENITGSVNLNLLDSKVNFGINAGSQKNNLENTEINELRRFVGSVNVSYTPKQTLSFSGSYSNFQSFTNVRQQFETLNDLTPFDNLDTLNFRQISQNANLNSNIILNQSKEKRQNLNVNVSYQTSKDEQNSSEGSQAGTAFINGNISYSHSLTESGLSMTASINSNVNSTSETKSSGLSPSLNISKAFLDKKLRTTVSSTYTTSKLDGVKAAQIFNVRLGASYTVKKKHRLNFNFVTLSRGAVSETQKGQTESTGTLSYNYSF